MNPMLIVLLLATLSIPGFAYGEQAGFEFNWDPELRKKYEEMLGKNPKVAERRRKLLGDFLGDVEEFTGLYPELGELSTYTGKMVGVYSIGAFEDLYARALHSAASKVANPAINAASADGQFNPKDHIINSTHSFQTLKEVGYFFLTNAKNPFDYERAAWFIVSSFMLEGRENNYKNELLWAEKVDFGLAAAIAAQEYADPNSAHHNEWRAYRLHYEAAAFGLQRSAIAAAYLYRFNDKSAFESAYHPADVISEEARILSWATKCTEENMSKPILPFTRDLCDLAEKQLTAVEARMETAENKYAEDNSAMWLLMGLVGLGVLAASQGADYSTAPEVKSYDSCRGLNGWGYWNNTVGNASATFGCSKY